MKMKTLAVAAVVCAPLSLTASAQECESNEDCQDGNPCTIDICDPSQPAADEFGCVYFVAVGSDCNEDNNLCTIEHCDGNGNCVFVGEIGCGPGEKCDRATGQCVQVNPCPWDLNDDGIVNVVDLLIVIGSWGPCAGCLADFNLDGLVNVLDLLALIGNWGLCPGVPCVWDVNSDGVVDQSDLHQVQENFGPCDGCSEDVNGDGFVNGQDVAAVATHFGPCPAPLNCPGEGPCNNANSTPGCHQRNCCVLVCDVDPYCCDTQWDQSCASEANALFPECQCPWDLNDDQIVDDLDMEILQGLWGTVCPNCPPYWCVGDFDKDCDIDIVDAGGLISNLGPCP